MEGGALGPPGVSPGGARGPPRRGRARACAFRAPRVSGEPQVAQARLGPEVGIGFQAAKPCARALQPGPRQRWLPKVLPPGSLARGAFSAASWPELWWAPREPGSRPGSSSGVRALRPRWRRGSREVSRGLLPLPLPLPRPRCLVGRESLSPSSARGPLLGLRSPRPPRPGCLSHPLPAPGIPSLLALTVFVTVCVSSCLPAPGCWLPRGGGVCLSIITPAAGG